MLFIACRSEDGQILVVSSSDGYCTVVRFDSGELGVPLPNSELPAKARRVILNNAEVSPTISPPTVHNVVSVPSNNQTTPLRENTQITSLAENSSEGLNRKSGPRRVQLITLSTIPQGIASSTATSTNTAAQQDASNTSTISPIVL